MGRSAVGVERLGQLAERQPDAALGGALGDAQLGGDLAEGEALQVGERDAAPLVVGQ